MSTQTDKIDVSRIVLERHEGMLARAVVTSLIAADSVLANWRHTVNHAGCDKCSFVVEFEDGRQYQGRYDLEGTAEDMPSLCVHIRSHLRFVTGEKRPARVRPEQYQQMLAGFDPALVKQANDVLNHYNI